MTDTTELRAEFEIDGENVSLSDLMDAWRLLRTELLALPPGYKLVPIPFARHQKTDGPTPQSDALERTRRAMGQDRTPAYGDALDLCRRLEAAHASATQQHESEVSKLREEIDTLRAQVDPAYVAGLKATLASVLESRQAAIAFAETLKPLPADFAQHLQDNFWDMLGDKAMILCASCGNKRCPHASDHRNACTNSNEPGQIGDAAALSASARTTGGEG